MVAFEIQYLRSLTTSVVHTAYLCLIDEICDIVYYTEYTVQKPFFEHIDLSVLTQSYTQKQLRLTRHPVVHTINHVSHSRNFHSLLGKCVILNTCLLIITK